MPSPDRSSVRHANRSDRIVSTVTPRVLLVEWLDRRVGLRQIRTRPRRQRAPPAVTAVWRCRRTRRFCGERPSLLNPEQLLVMAAASSCQLLSFLAVAARARVDVVAYEDRRRSRDAGGRPAHADQDDPVAFHGSSLRQGIFGRAGQRGSAFDSWSRLAHHECYIANSLKTEITVEPVIEWR